MNHIVAAAKEAYKGYEPTSNVSEANKRVNNVLKRWSKILNDSNIPFNVQVLEKTIVADEVVEIKEIFDVLITDINGKTAYEMKVSGKNAHHEFYKDLFKIVIYNKYHTDRPISNFCFLTQHIGVGKIKRLFGKNVIIHFFEQYNVNVSLEQLD